MIVGRALTRFPSMTPGFDSRTRRHMWLEFIVVGSRPLLREAFLQVFRFPPPFKNQHFQIPTRSGIRGPQVSPSPSLNKGSDEIDEATTLCSA